MGRLEGLLGREYCPICQSSFPEESGHGHECDIIQIIQLESISRRRERTSYEQYLSSIEELKKRCLNKTCKSCDHGHDSDDIVVGRCFDCYSLLAGAGVVYDPNEVSRRLSSRNVTHPNALGGGLLDSKDMIGGNTVEIAEIRSRQWKRGD
jgi:hypothetical protein